MMIVKMVIMVYSTILVLPDNKQNPWEGYYSTMYMYL